MFDVRFIVDGSVVESPTPLTLVSPHGRLAEFPRGTAIERDRLESLPDLAHNLWPAAEVPDGLLTHVVREALASDLIVGTTPETYSPLGDVRPDSFGRWAAADGLADGHPEVDSLSAHVRSTRFTRTGSPVIEFIVGGEVMSALAFGPDAVVVPVPGNVDAVELVDRLPGDVDDAVELLAAAVPGADVRELVLWRLYTGDNSWVRDVVGEAGDDRVHRLGLRTVGRLGVLVGRTVKVAARMLDRNHGDPFATRRLHKAEVVHHDVTASCPRLEKAGHESEAVVTVHGTMSTGLALAAAVRGCPGPLPAIRRFEHNTWLPVEVNAEALASLVAERVTEHVLFVAHSRGGLVARHAADILRAQGSGLTIETLTLGTPFLGTPVADAASVGFRGVQALLGGLRWPGFSVVEPLTRLAGLALLSGPPKGITDMSPGPGYLSGFKIHPLISTTTFAGRVDEAGPDSYGLSFLRGFAEEIMDAGDLVVPARSAKSGVDDSANVLECDHFSYLEQPEVMASIEKPVGHLPSIRTRRNQAFVRNQAKRTTLDW